MMKLCVTVMLLGLMVIGCGVNKEYVADQIAQSEARTSGQIGTLSDKTDMNAAEVAKLKQLSQELASKTDMALNKAAGFENYQILWEGEINFDFDSYDINDVAAQILNEAGMKLEAHGGSVIEITGYTDKTGNAKYNLMLGEQRASAAKRYLADTYGISLYRMFVNSFGEEKPISMPDERNANSKNRRVKLVIWGQLTQ